MRNFFRLLFFVCFSMIASASFAQVWTMKKATLMTQFAAKVDTANVLAEYPRPQMVRENWMNLNGIWQFQPTLLTNNVPPVGSLSRKILVPFPVESAISGVMTHYERLWYRRSFTVPNDWADQRILIHFGAVDYESEVFVNGHSLGIHKGGYDPFTYDITPYLTESGAQDLLVRVYDPTDKAGQPRGKQTLNPGGIMYTCSSGIWQTVWLEPVPQTSISNIKIIPDVDASTLRLKVSTTGVAANQTVSIAVKDNGNVVATFQGAANSELVIPISNPKLWSPNSPFLYDLDIKLNSEGTGIDSLKSYFGMRKISLAKVGAYQKMMLNNQFLFQMGPLDQGWWPDGLYTAPTDLALKYDIEKMKTLGFNMVRKHIKVESARWYYWADKLGLMVWQDMPSANTYLDPHPEIDVEAFHTELVKMVENHWNSPSIVMWVIFNEWQGQHNTKELSSEVKTLDPSRLVNQGSGGGWDNAGDILDSHNYSPPGIFDNNGSQALVCGEYGGIGFTIPGHIWKDGNPYITVNSGTALANLYDEYANYLVQFKTNEGLSAAVYTEITDVEGELNGFMTYDRFMVKTDPRKIAASNNKIINKAIYLTPILPAATSTIKTWQYTTTQPAANWYLSGFNTSTWKNGIAGFGDGTSNVHTSWKTSDIWLRQEFNVGDLTSTIADSLAFLLNYDEGCEIYLNGTLVASFTGYVTKYIFFNLSDAAKKALKPNAKNLIAIHCTQTYGGQYIDAGIYIYGFDKKPLPLGISDNKADGNFGIFPNPAIDDLQISGFDDQKITATVFNAFGGQVLQQKGNIKTLNVSTLSEGVYLLKVEGQNESRCFKFSKRK